MMTKLGNWLEYGADFVTRGAVTRLRQLLARLDAQQQEHAARLGEQAARLGEQAARLGDQAARLDALAERLDARGAELERRLDTVERWLGLPRDEAALTRETSVDERIERRMALIESRWLALLAQRGAGAS